jgi:hypothetical protein
VFNWKTRIYSQIMTHEQKNIKVFFETTRNYGIQKLWIMPSCTKAQAKSPVQLTNEGQATSVGYHWAKTDSQSSPWPSTTARVASAASLLDK